jgi:two-component system response regulator DesR
LIQVVVADDYPAVREGICRILATADDILVIGVAEDGAEAVELARELSPDVVVMDILMPGVDGIEAAEEIKQLGLKTRVLMVSMYGQRTLVESALKSGAQGYVLKSDLFAELTKAIRAVRKGSVYLSKTLKRVEG